MFLQYQNSIFIKTLKHTFKKMYFNNIKTIGLNHQLWLFKLCCNILKESNDSEFTVRSVSCYTSPASSVCIN